MLGRLPITLLAILAVTPATAAAAWLPNGTPLVTRFDAADWSARIAPDGEGGVFAAWAWDFERILRIMREGGLPPDWAGELAPSRPDGAIVTWTDDRESPDPRADKRTSFVMRLGPDGPAVAPR